MVNFYVQYFFKIIFSICANNYTENQLKFLIYSKVFFFFFEYKLVNTIIQLYDKHMLKGTMKDYTGIFLCVKKSPLNKCFTLVTRFIT